MLSIDVTELKKPNLDLFSLSFDKTVNCKEAVERCIELLNLDTALSYALSRNGVIFHETRELDVNGSYKLVIVPNEEE
ncbi:MAG: hypothetical protein LBR74_09860 [Eubacterium sp.]|jgi:hypothetical protein|nr:hypothetical protein [Eubacterium sp.]